LDRGRRGVALENDGAQDGLGEPKFVKCHERSLGRVPGPEGGTRAAFSESHWYLAVIQWPLGERIKLRLL
jgi:hypothetical protein